jgi:hypothetical protein
LSVIAFTDFSYRIVSNACTARGFDRLLRRGVRLFKIS